MEIDHIGHRHPVDADQSRRGLSDDGHVVRDQLGLVADPSHLFIPPQLGKSHLLGGGRDAFDARRGNGLGSQQEPRNPDQLVAPLCGHRPHLPLCRSHELIQRSVKPQGCPDEGSRHIARVLTGATVPPRHTGVHARLPMVRLPHRHVVPTFHDIGPTPKFRSLNFINEATRSTLDRRSTLRSPKQRDEATSATASRSGRLLARRHRLGVMTGTSSGDVNSFGFEVDRGLGAVELVSCHTLSPFSRAGWQAADNLLTKAKRWFTSGDENRAMALVDRAAALRYDDHEDAAPAVLAAEMMLFSAITDELERSDEADSRWLDAALYVLGSADEATRFEVRDALVPIRQGYHLSKREERMIDAATKGIAPRTGLRDTGPLPAQHLHVPLVATIRATIAYEAAIAALAVEPVPSLDRGGLGYRSSDTGDEGVADVQALVRR